MEKTELQAKKESIAAEILGIAKSTLLVNMRFLSAALIRLDLEPYEGTIATDARKVYYNPDHIIALYKAGKEETVRAYLHMLLHCLFRHPYSLAERRMWDLACDIAVESIIGEWKLPCTNVKLAAKRRECAEKIKAKTKFLTAEKIYAYLCTETIFELTLQEWEKLFTVDDHSGWGFAVTVNISASGKSVSKAQTRRGGSGDQNDQDGSDDQSDQGGSDGQNDQNDQSGSQAQGSGGGGRGGSDGQESGGDSTEQEWKEIAERLQTDMETFSSEWGNRSGSMMMSLREVNREKYNYESFLKKFAVLSEAMKINDDEFDYVFYTLGLSMYGNMPLVEPLEYKDVKQIKEFVIAIDTSGSVAGDKVQAFIRKTYNILKAQESFRHKVNIHIIQCDAEIQQDTKITTLDELEKFFTDMKLFGFGGTDFRPVFEYVDRLITGKEFTNLKGLIYFTDGFGDFPQRKPKYNTAFVFVDDNYNNYDVPSWAIKLILEPKDI